MATATRIVTWTASRNSERQALRNFPGQWETDAQQLILTDIHANPLRAGAMFIWPIDRRDEGRWVDVSRCNVRGWRHA